MPLRTEKSDPPTTEARRRFGSDRGAVMAEYGMLLALMAVAMIAAITAMRGSLFSTYIEADSEVQEIMIEGSGSTP